MTNIDSTGKDATSTQATKKVTVSLHLCQYVNSTQRFQFTANLSCLFLFKLLHSVRDLNIQTECEGIGQGQGLLIKHFPSLQIIIESEYQSVWCLTTRNHVHLFLIFPCILLFNHNLVFMTTF